MRIEIAGIPVEVQCRYSSNEAFFREYLTDKTPAFSITPTAEDLEMIRRELARADGAEAHTGDERPEQTLENHAIHFLLAEKLLEYDVLLLHGSALSMDGQAYIFAAPCGTGKSTHARLWREVFGDRVTMLNDDKPLLRITGGGTVVYGSPWNGRHCLSSNVCAPLRAIAFLNRSTYNDVAPITKAEAFPLLMRQAFFSRKPGLAERIVALGKTLLETTPFYRLNCNTDPEAAITARDGMLAGGDLNDKL